ncbi:MAG: UDP-N-acetylglucosamine 2-epimerase (non-hydrolyzing), partial [Lentisphaeria bacterium]|nr:UDP-N-acetylglucosamine 2-epimerase (non-hydrolyzing) [Lentisphaeria bacterium]
MMKILVVFGTRPEAIKTAPVILALRQRKDCQVKVCFTGQHRDMAMPFMELFGVEPEISFRIDNASLSGSVAEILQKMDGLLNAEKFDWVLVQGDTNTVLAASLAAFYHRVKVGHIEAGLRTHRKMFPYPEEMNRLLTTRIADLHFAPTPQARENLLREGVEEKDIVVTGNTVIDALWIILKKLENDPESEKRLLEKFPFLAPEKKLVLVTCHRRENQGNGLETLCGTLKKSVAGHEELQFVYPVHLSPAVRGVVLPLLQGEKNIH